MEYAPAEFRKGLKIEVEGEPFIIVDFQHVKPGKGSAFVRTRMKSMVTGNVIDRNFRSGDTVGVPELDEKQMQFMYKDDEGSYHFMDTSTYEQTFLAHGELGEAVDWLKEQLDVTIMFYKGKAIGVEVPTFVDLQITQTDPSFKGDTASGGGKPAILETGAKVMVPFHLKEGDVIKVDTRSYKYIERVG